MAMLFVLMFLLIPVGVIMVLLRFSIEIWNLAGPANPCGVTACC